MLKILARTSLLMMIFMGSPTMAIEEANYNVISIQDSIELRYYASHVLAETIVNEHIEDAGNAAFKPLFDYISGNNTRQIEIAMTAPVSQQSVSQSITMTAPVSQQKSGDGWAIGFMMPAEFTLNTLPEPNNPNVILRAVPEQFVAAIRYSGFWSESNYLEHKGKLENWIKQSHYRSSGEAVWARYNAPFTPWFLRRNEVLIPVVEINSP